MPKLIDYPRTGYPGAWELAEVTDDTGGKCSIETAAKKLNRKVSGSFKAIIGSAVKYGLVTSKRELLSTTTLFKRIKHAYDKQEELLFHREAFLTPPLFAQICRKFRSRELPIQMLDVILIREFGVEEINAQGVAKAFVEGCRMVGILDEHNIMADIDSLNQNLPPRKSLASTTPSQATFPLEAAASPALASQPSEAPAAAFGAAQPTPHSGATSARPLPGSSSAPRPSNDPIATLFGLPMGVSESPEDSQPLRHEPGPVPPSEIEAPRPTAEVPQGPPPLPAPPDATATLEYYLQVSGPGINTTLSLTAEEDLLIASALLEKIRRQLKG